jgi:hypothetical protein
MNLTALPAIITLLLKYGPSIIGFLQTEGPRIVAFIQQADAFRQQLQAASTQPGVAPSPAVVDAATLKAGTMAAASVITHLGGVAPADLQKFLAGLPIPIPMGTFSS